MLQERRRMLYGTPPFAVLSAFPLWQSIQHSPVRISSSAFHFGRHDEIGKRVIRIILHDSLSPELPVFLIELLPMEEVGQIALFFRALSVGTSYTAELIRGFLQKGVRLFLVHAGFLVSHVQYLLAGWASVASATGSACSSHQRRSRCENGGRDGL